MQRVIPAFTQFRCAPPPSTVKLGGMFSQASHERRMRLRKGSVVASPRLAPPLVASLNIFTLTHFLGVMFFPVWKRVSPLPLPSEDSLEPTVSSPPLALNYRVNVPHADEATIEALLRDVPLPVSESRVMEEEEEVPRARLSDEEILFGEDLYPTATQAAVRQYLTIVHMKGEKHWALEDVLWELGYEDDKVLGITALSQVYSQMGVFLRQQLKSRMARWLEGPTHRGYRAIRFRFQKKEYVAIVDFAQRGVLLRVHFRGFMTLARYDQTNSRPKLRCRRDRRYNGHG